ncbi:MAG TPA: glycosyltransferase [Candidatus Bathyarchaeia archaeon]|nr:glycosyltransferase [Candidatus Bathyarchaeia archaeon]
MRNKKTSPRQKLKHLAGQELVSIIMPVYNAADFLVESIQSIINQIYKSWELIIIDDASTDKSSQIIKRFKTRYPKKIKVIRLAKNLNRGGDACANLAFQMSRGEFVARMDADDIAHPKRLEKQVKFLQKNPDIFMVGTQAWVIDKQGRKVGKKDLPLSPKDIYRNYAVFHPMIHPTIMFRKNEVDSDELYKIRFSANNDLLTFFEFLKTKKFANLRQRLLYYRVHGKNDSLTGIKEKYFNTLKIRLLAVKEFNYRPNFKALLINLIQFFTVALLPEKALLLLYLLAKGIITPQSLLPATFRLKLKYA